MIHEVLALRIDQGAQRLVSQVLLGLIVVVLYEPWLHEGHGVITDLSGQ